MAACSAYRLSRSASSSLSSMISPQTSTLNPRPSTLNSKPNPSTLKTLMQVSHIKGSGVGFRVES